jgi:hypothetical protein
VSRGNRSEPPPSRPSVARRLQLRLEHFYRLEPAPPVDDFAVDAGTDGREVVFVRDPGAGNGRREDVEIAVSLPAAGLAPPPDHGEVSLDELCQIIEGVSHFVYLADRIRLDRPMTQLELELQAEVDKFVVLGFAALRTADTRTAWRMVNRLYQGVVFVHERHTEEGERYRIANDLAATFCARAIRGLGGNASGNAGVHSRFLRFHREGQAEKVWLAVAA